MKALAAVAVVFALFAPTALSMHSTAPTRTETLTIAWRVHVHELRTRTWHYQDLRKARRSETRYLERRVRALPRLQRLAHYWYERAVAARRAYARYSRARSAPPAVAHLALWRCITNGAYPGAPHEGNGYNGAYTGWLGMSTPWMGHMPPGSDWVHSDQMAVYAIAEQEYRNSGYSSSWLHGQWPATSPPCAAYQ